MQCTQGLALVSVSWGPEQFLLRQPWHMKVPWKASFCPLMSIACHSQWPSWIRLLCPRDPSGLRETNWDTPAPGRQDGMGAEGRKCPSKGHHLERGSDLRRDPPGNRNSDSPQKGSRGQRLWGVTKLEGSVGQNNEVKRGVSSHVPWGHPDALGTLAERSG